MQNALYIRLQAGFSQWLRILNFEPTSQRDMPKLLAEFVDYLELQNCTHPHKIQEHHLKAYLASLYERPCKTKAGAISLNYIRKHVQVIKKFSRYLTESGQESFTVNVRIKGKGTAIKSILSTQEIMQVYQATKDDPLGQRDKAMLALYYGCGLRKNEGLSVDVSDILLEKDLVYIRKGKGHKARYVPLTGQHKTDLESYLTYGRPYLTGHTKEEALLLNVNGKRLKTAYDRLQKLKAIAGIKKPMGLHTLRHSIASHLLHSGMKLEQIGHFLGHSSLESTQIYTHLKHEQV